jgi:hypothetical protein
MENAWSYQLKNGRIGTKNTLFYTPLKRAEIGQLCRLLFRNPKSGGWESVTGDPPESMRLQFVE